MTRTRQWSRLPRFCGAAAFVQDRESRGGRAAPPATRRRLCRQAATAFIWGLQAPPRLHIQALLLGAAVLGVRTGAFCCLHPPPGRSPARVDRLLLRHTTAPAAGAPLGAARQPMRVAAEAHCSPQRGWLVAWAGAAVAPASNWALPSRQTRTRLPAVLTSRRASRGQAAAVMATASGRCARRSRLSSAGSWAPLKAAFAGSARQTTRTTR